VYAPVLGAVTLLLSAAGHRPGGPAAWQALARPSALPAQVADGRPVRAVPPGVGARDDCAHVPPMVEPDCRPRTPTALPAGGGAAVVSADPALAAQMLCSALPDAAVRKVRGGPFLVFTNGRGECHFERTGLRAPEHSVALTATLSALPLAAHLAADGALSQPFAAGPLPAGYLALFGATRLYRVGLHPGQPRAPGTLLVAARYIRFAGPHTLPAAPVLLAPARFWAGADAYVRQLAGYLSR
jgi:hypothetical protein